MERNLFNELVAGMEAYQQHQAGKITLKTVEVEQPKPVQISPEEIRAIREKLQLSQAVFARKLRTSVRTYQGWEQGKTRPNPQATLLLKMVEQSPQIFNTISAV